MILPSDLTQWEQRGTKITGKVAHSSFKWTKEYLLLKQTLRSLSFS